jgi:hypothetical protein
MKDYMLNRLREPSTWRGFIMLLTALGVALDAVQTEAVIALGMALVGAVGVFLPDSRNS